MNPHSSGAVTVVDEGEPAKSGANSPYDCVAGSASSTSGRLSPVAQG